MTPKQAIRDFTDKYPVKAIISLRDMAKDNTLAMAKFKSSSFTESGSKFMEYLEGYVEFKINGKATHKAIDDSVIAEKGNAFIDTIFTERVEPCHEAVTLVSNYFDQLKQLDSAVERHTGALLEAGVDSHSVGMVADMADRYVGVLTERMDAAMTVMLQTSGYTTSQKLAEACRPKAKVDKNDNYFL